MPAMAITIRPFLPFFSWLCCEWAPPLADCFLLHWQLLWCVQLLWFVLPGTKIISQKDIVWSSDWSLLLLVTFFAVCDQWSNIGLFIANQQIIAWCWFDHAFYGNSRCLLLDSSPKVPWKTKKLTLRYRAESDARMHALVNIKNVKVSVSSIPQIILKQEMESNRANHVVLMVTCYFLTMDWRESLGIRIR
jgi:hypothetical protein